VTSQTQVGRQIDNCVSGLPRHPCEDAGEERGVGPCGEVARPAVHENDTVPVIQREFGCKIALDMFEPARHREAVAAVFETGMQAFDADDFQGKQRL
jgi:hypothetical protein